jgi:hypothetical protein
VYYTIKERFRMIIDEGKLKTDEEIKKDYEEMREKRDCVIYSLEELNYYYNKYGY